MKLKFRILTFVLCIAMLLGSMSVFSVAAEATVITPTGYHQFSDRETDWLIWLNSTGTLPSTPGALYGQDAVPVKLYDADGNVVASTEQGNLFSCYLQDGTWFCPMIYGPYAQTNSPKAGDMIEMAAGTYNSNKGDGTAITLEETLFLKYDGTNWELYKEPVVLDSLTVLPGASQADRIYAGISADKALTFDSKWENRFRPADASTGIFFTHDGATTQIYPDSTPSQGFPVADYNEGVAGIGGSLYINGFGTAVAGDKVTLKGTWHSNKTSENFTVNGEIIFTFDGNVWTIDYVKPEVKGIEVPYLDALLVHANGQQLYTSVPDEGIKLTAETNWTNRFLPYSKDAATYYNGVKTALYEPHGMPYQGSAGKNGFWFLMPSVPNAGDKMSVQGTWYSATFDEYVTFVAPVEFTWDGATWARTSEAPEFEVTYDHVFSGSFSTPHDGTTTYFYINGSESLNNVFFDGTWADRLEPEVELESGIFLNGVKEATTSEGKLLHLNDGSNWFVSWNTAAKAGDIVTIKGDFVSTKYSTKITIEECKFIYDGSAWAEYVENTKVYNELTITGPNHTDYLLVDPNNNVPNSWDYNYAGLTVTLNGNAVTAFDFKKPNGGDVYFKLIGVELAKGDKVVISGQSDCTNNADQAGIKLTAPATLYWDGANWATELVNDKVYNELTLGAPHPTDADTFLVEGTTNVPDSWDYNYTGLTVSLNGNVVSAYDFKKPGSVYLKLLNVTLAKGDVLTISGQSDCTSHPDQAGIKLTAPATYYWDGAKWVSELPNEEEITYVPITVAGTVPPTGLVNDGTVWHVYLSVSDILPGANWEVIDNVSISFDQVVEIDGVSYVVTAKKANEQTLFIEFPNSYLSSAEGHTLVIKAGKYKSNLGGYGYEVTEDFTLNGDGNSWTVPETGVYDNVYFNGAAHGWWADKGYWDIHYTTETELPGTDWVTIYGNIVVEIDGVVVSAVVKKAGLKTLNVFYPGAEPQVGTTVTIKAGKSPASEVGVNGISIAEDYTMTWNGTKLVANTVDTTIYSDLQASSLAGFGTADGDWRFQLNVEGYWPNVEGDLLRLSGMAVYINDTLIADNILQVYKNNKNLMFCIWGPLTADTAPVEGDKVVIKAGKAKILDTEYGINLIRDVVLTYDGSKWVLEGYVDNHVYSEVTLQLPIMPTGYSSSSDRWDFYFPVNGTLPGIPDGGEFFDYMQVSVVNSKGETVLNHYNIRVWNAAHGNGTFFFIIDGSVLPLDQVDKGSILTVHAGKVGSSTSNNGIKLTEDFSVKYTGSMWLSMNYDSLKPSQTDVELSIDRSCLYGGNANGIYLLTDDILPVDKTWVTRIAPADYDGISGVYLNDVRIDDVYICRFDEGKLYIALIDAGVQAKDKDKVTIKGMFFIEDLGVTYKEYSVYFNGKQWNETYQLPPKTTYTKFNVEKVDPVSSYSTNSKHWNTYLRLDTMIPGDIDTMSFSGLKIIGANGKEYDAYVAHSYQHCLYLNIPDEVLPYESENGAYVILKAGRALANDQVSGIQLMEDVVLYFYKGSLSTLEPTDDTAFEEVTITRLNQTFRYDPATKEWRFWWQILSPVEGVETGTAFGGVTIEFNGKEHDIIVMRDGNYLFGRIPEGALPGNTRFGTIKVKAGSKGYANSGHNGIVIMNDWECYLYEGLASEVQFEETTRYTFDILGVQAATPTSTQVNLYLRVSSEVPGTEWYERYAGFTYYYNGKPIEAEALKPGSSNHKFFYFPLVYKDIGREPQEGDTVTVYPNTVGYGGGYEIEVTNEFTLVYKDGLWTPYVETDVEAPAPTTDNIWEEFRFEDAYIPVLQDNGKVLWSNEDKYHDIISIDTHMDYTFNFEVQKVYDDETTPPFYVILRGNQVSEEDAMTAEMLYGYVVQFSAAEIQDPADPTNPEATVWSQYISLWKNGVNGALIDQYRVNYVWEQTDHPFFQYEDTHNYEFSIYNITETMACITVKVDGRLVLRYYDTATSDPMDPAVNAGSFVASASCPGYITGDAVELPEMIIAATECETGDRVRVAATYPSVLTGAVFTVDSADAEVKNGMFVASKAGTYTISCTYNGKDLGSKTIVVKDPPKRELLDVGGDETEFPWLIVIIAGGAVIIAAAVLVIILALAKRKKKAAKAE